MLIELLDSCAIGTHAHFLLCYSVMADQHSERGPSLICCFYLYLKCEGKIGIVVRDVLLGC